jgi:formylglycine-generating enzyme
LRPNHGRHLPLLGALLGLGCGTEPAALSSVLDAELVASLPMPARASRKPERCPSDMVDVAGRFCIDRFEITLVDKSTGRAFSPYYHPSRKLAERDRAYWARKAPESGPWPARSIPLPELPEWHDLGRGVARSEPGKIPSAFFDLAAARKACENAGKRLCTHDEWVAACRGDKGTRHPYGEQFEPRRCNIERSHPNAQLHSHKQIGPFDAVDPRMSTLEDREGALLLPTGALHDCKSPWGDDAIYDMVGNLDEWIDDPAGTFLGGFYARGWRFGCDSRIERHSADYYDYSLGGRCCADSAQ